MLTPKFAGVGSMEDYYEFEPKKYQKDTGIDFVCGCGDFRADEI